MESMSIEDKLSQSFIEELNEYQINAVKNSELETKILLSRKLYSIGETPVYEDRVYDELLNYPTLMKYKTMKYEDDLPIKEVSDLLTILGGELRELDVTIEEEKLRMINKFDTNTSMLMVTTPEDFLHKFLAEYMNERTEYFILDYKHDGWNVTGYYTPESDEIVYAHTRGRDGAKSSEVTEIIRTLAPKMKVKSLTKVVGELVIKRSRMKELKEAYPEKKWANIRSSLGSFTANHIDPKYYDALEWKTFNIESIREDFGGPIEKKVFLKEHGFQIPTYMQIRPNMDDMKQALGTLINYYTETYRNEYECDGLVVQAKIKDDKLHSNMFSGYSVGMIAVKAWVWASEIMQSKVTEIVLSESKNKFTPKALVEPVQSTSGSMVRTVPFDNLRHIAEHWVEVGDVIEFEYQSQQNVYFLRKVSGSERPKPVRLEEDEQHSGIENTDMRF